MCEVCDGTLKVNLIDVWEVSRRIGEGIEDWTDLPPPLIKDMPCVKCQSADFWGAMNALTEKKGPAYSDGPITGIKAMVHPEWGRAYAPTTQADDDEALNEDDE